ncbi:hypothetical protein [Aeromicrobium sp. HA]|uniref:hypothetical protein n=1 Tax=Aeromicrobium sp. HA TaxID=3009077 RepID=UPI0022AFB92C|nr:hypothetical protein [Aeromicrobium sp. HA]
MAENTTDLVSAMVAGDVLLEAERRYEIIAKMLDPGRSLGENERPLTGTEVKSLSIEADRLMHKIVALRAEKAADEKKQGGSDEGDPDLGKVVAFDADRFRRSS